MSFKTIAGGFNGAFWWYWPLSEDREILKQIYQNYLVAFRWGDKTLYLKNVKCSGEPKNMAALTL